MSVLFQQTVQIHGDFVFFLVDEACIEPSDEDDLKLQQGSDNPPLVVFH